NVATTGTAVPVTAPGTTTINFALAPGGTVTGTVTNAVTGAPLNLVPMQLYDLSGRTLQNTATNASGVYTFSSGVPSGSYLARTVGGSGQGLIDELYNDIPCPPVNCNVLAGTPISVTTGLATTANFALSPGGSFSGVITNAVTGSQPSLIQVSVYNSAGIQIS